MLSVVKCGKCSGRSGLCEQLCLEGLGACPAQKNCLLISKGVCAASTPLKYTVCECTCSQTVLTKISLTSLRTSTLMVPGYGFNSQPTLRKYLSLSLSLTCTFTIYLSLPIYSITSTSFIYMYTHIVFFWFVIILERLLCYSKF